MWWEQLSLATGLCLAVQFACLHWHDAPFARMHSDTSAFLLVSCRSEPLAMSDSMAQQLDPDIEAKRAEAAKMAWGDSPSATSRPAAAAEPALKVC